MKPFALFLTSALLLAVLAACSGGTDYDPYPDGDDTTDGDADRDAPENPVDGDIDGDGNGDADENSDGDRDTDGDEEEHPDCLDRDPCTVDYRNANDECVHDPYCTASNKTVCTAENDAPVCHCDSGYTETGDGDCVKEADHGRTCADPIVLDVFGGNVSGDTTGSGNDDEGSCNDETDEELVYVFELEEARTVIFHATGFDTILYVRADCDDAGTELACSDDEGGNLTARIEREFPAGSYFLFVDGFHGLHGEFELSIEVRCAEGQLTDPGTGDCVDDPCKPNPCLTEGQRTCEPLLPDAYECLCSDGWIPKTEGDGCIPDPQNAGESCADPVELLAGEGSVTGSTANAQDNGEGSCSSDRNDGPDRVYRFTLTAQTRVNFLMTGYDTLLHLRSDCADSRSELVCNDDAVERSAQIIEVLDPGTYFLFADSYSDGGAYELHYSFRENPCGPETCPGDPVCEPSVNWEDYACVCPDGTIAYGEQCVDDPCAPNPCQETNKNRCEPLLPADFACSCNPGYIDEGNGTCIVDPNANDWSFMVYMNADNNLEEDGFLDLEEMAAAGSTPNVHIVALFDTYTADGGRARKIYVTGDGFTTLEDMGEQDMSDWHTLADFGVWAVQTYPARKRALILWNHGEGWSRRSASPDEDPLFKGFSNDDHGSSYEQISIAEGDYAQALTAITDAAGGKLDLVGFDACLMGTWEVAEATAPFADYLVASEETIPLSGWSYDDFLVPLVNDPDMTAEQLAVSIVDTYHDEKTDNSTLSAIDLGQISGLTRMLSNLANTLMDHDDLYADIEEIRDDTQNFSWMDTTRDIGDFAARLQNMPGAPADLLQAGQSLLTQYGQTVVHSRNQNDYPGATGLRIYFPAHHSDFRVLYQSEGAVWSARSTWDEFLIDFTR